MLKYLDSLKLTPEANLYDVKNAFRKLAKTYHPDLNHAENSTSIFIAIREAYDFILNYYKDLNVPDVESITNIISKQKQDTFTKWIDYQKNKVRKQAEYEAKMKYKNFIKTNTYKESVVYNKVVNYIFLITGILIITGAFYGIIHTGIYYFENGNEILNLNEIVTVIFVTIIGIILIVFSRVNIKINI